VPFDAPRRIVCVTALVRDRAGNPEIAVVHEDFGALAEAQGDFEEADAAYERAFDTWVRIAGPEHPGPRSVQRRRARLWFEHAQAVDDPDEAIALAARAREIFAADDKSTDDRQRVDRWLKEHRR
jgi:hypothetical protein